jgi:hypothetical protein
MRVFLEGVGIAGPGLDGWDASLPVLAGVAPYVASPTLASRGPQLPAAERRRIGVPVKLALAAGYEAFTHAGRDAATTATVFTSSGGDGDNVNAICDALAKAEREMSPTRFHNSVHNAPAGYWSIATRSQRPSTSLCGYDASFAAGLLETMAQVTVENSPVALIAYDQPYPRPLAQVRPIGAEFAAALLFTPDASERSFARVAVEYRCAPGDASAMTDGKLEMLRRSVPAARCLPLLAALAKRESASVILEYLSVSHLRIEVAPC